MATSSSGRSRRSATISRRPTTSPSSTSRSPGGARTTSSGPTRKDPRRSACRQAARHRARALHPRHAADPLRRGRLERLAAAGRPDHARLDGQQLDGRAALTSSSTAMPRCCAGSDDDDSAKDLRDARGGRCAPTSTATSSATAPSPAMPCSTRRGKSPELLLHPTRHPHRSPLFAAADDAQHHRRAVHPAAGAASSSA